MFFFFFSFVDRFGAGTVDGIPENATGDFRPTEEFLVFIWKF
jgi:hypothetical protein